MKKVLIVTEGFHNGGVEKSLSDFLKNINNVKIDIICLSESTYMPTFNDNINISYYNDYSINFFKPLFTSLKYFLYKKEYIMFLKRVLLSILAKLKYKKVTTYSYKCLKNSFKRLEKEYDIVIAFKDGLSWYFVANHVTAHTKIAWNHVDVDKIDCDIKYTKTVLNSFTRVYCVSKSSLDVFNKFYHLNNVAELFYNYIDSDSIVKRSLCDINVTLVKNELNLVTVGRLCNQKGQDLIIDVSIILKEQNYKFKWFLVGDGQNREKLLKKVAKYHLEKYVIFCGSTKNPYPYMKKCDIYVQPSRYEGFGLTLAEAKILSKRIIATNIPQFLEQDDGAIKYIPFDKKRLYNAIVNYKEDIPLRDKINVNYDESKEKFKKIVSLTK